MITLTHEEMAVLSKRRERAYKICGWLLDIDTDRVKDYDLWSIDIHWMMNAWAEIDQEYRFAKIEYEALQNA